MFILTYANLYDDKPTVSVCTGNLKHATHLFSVLATAHRMQYVEVMDSHGCMRREWDCENGFTNVEKT